MFKEVPGPRRPYFIYDLDGVTYINYTDSQIDSTVFAERDLFVSSRATGAFTSDLKRDDVLLAFLSLLLLLVIEGICTTLLLRTHQGKLSNFGFSVKQFIELVQDFHFHQIFIAHNTKAKASRKRKVNKRLVCTALAVLFVIFGLEVSVIFLTAPRHTSVTNRSVSLRLQIPVIPPWRLVKWNVRAATEKPCDSVVLIGVDQGEAAVTPCVTWNTTRSPDRFFEKAKGKVTLTVVTDLHQYGAEHIVRVGDLSAIYSTRALYTLGDGKPRLMSHRKQRPANETEIMKVVHSLFLAYLFTAYFRATEDKSMNLERLNELHPRFARVSPGPPVAVLQTKKGPVISNTTRYWMTVGGIIPQGEMVLHFAQQFFRCAAAVVVDGPDETDLFVERGPSRASAVVWREKSRVLNWLSLSLILLLSFCLLTALRLKLKPSATAEIAAMFVKGAVGADSLRSPVEISKAEDTYFRVSPVVTETDYLNISPIGSDRSYRYGAETQDGWTVMEYTDT